MKYEFEQWKGFNSGAYTESIDVRAFIQSNYKPYNGDSSFLCGTTERTAKVKSELDRLLKLEQEKGGVLNIQTDKVSSLLSFEPGYIDKENELIVGLQTDEPLKRAVNPFGGIRMARGACEAYGYQLDPIVETEFRYRTTHNDGVFHV